MGQLDATDPSVTWLTARLTLLGRRARIRIVGACVLVLAGVGLPAGDAGAHLNSPDLFHEGMAGPYKLLITIRPPDVIPGVAAIEVLASRPDLRAVTLVPLTMRGPGAISPPIADIAARDPGDPRRFQGRLWLMATGSWQVRVHADGPDGAGELSVPVAAIARRTLRMQAGLGALLVGLLAFLFAGMVGIIGASVRDADLPEGTLPDARRRRHGRIAQLTTAAVLAVAIAGGWSWWGQEASFYGRLVYRPLALDAQVIEGSVGGGGEPARSLALTLTDPGWIASRHLDDLLPDHGHLMHLFVVRTPGLDVIAHLHPNETAAGHFTQPLPALPDGAYQLFADIVHGNGLAETATASITLPDAASSRSSSGGTNPAALTGDDAVGTGAPITTGGTMPARDDSPVAALPDGTRVVWRREPLVAGRASWFRFQVQNRDGSPARDIVPYMGMAGHAVFLRDDRSVFAHVHPSGSVPMAALALVAGIESNPHAGH
jgi:hypothetical protein